MQAFLTAALVMGGLSAACAAVLAIAYRYLRVEEDPRLEVLDDLLPGNNCGACGLPGCHAFAEKLLVGETEPGGCTVSSETVLVEIAEFLGVDVGGGEKRAARLKCAGESGVVGKLATYQGIATCRGAVLVNGGGRACTWGCLGLGDCERACTFDVIRMNPGGLPVVEVDGCTACGDCVDVCPLDLFEILPLAEKLLVQCSSPLAGDTARAICDVACDACGRCAADAPAGTIEMQGGLPVIDRDADAAPSVAATWRCPTGAIAWVEGEQFLLPAERIRTKVAHG